MMLDIDSLCAYVQRACPRLNAFLSGLSVSEREALNAAIADTPNPRSTAGRLDDLLNEDRSGVIAPTLNDQTFRPAFLAAVAGSGFLFSVARRNLHLVGELFLHHGCLVRKTRSIHEQELRARIHGVSATGGLDRILRGYKEEEYLRIGSRDLAGTADTREVMAELSDLACACVEAALEFHVRRLAEKHWLPEAAGDHGGCVALGMGKISGGELNFSSDVDLIFLRGPEEGRTGGPVSVSVAQFYETLVRAVTRSLSDVTEDGFVFRVDLRLRPEGEKGELIPSVNNALDYYLGWGRTWERAALMKARPIAGDLALGRGFIEELEPFIYRKHLDYSTLDEMREMKLRIEAQLRRKPGVNIKLGQGGIREIEFFVQTLQLINGGRTPRVRSAATLEALELLREAGLLDGKTAESLRDAYLFFRLTEHRIQINHQLQTHELPRTLEDQEELARRMGYRHEPLKTFLNDLGKHRHAVEELFSGMFYQSEEQILQQVSPRARRIVESVLDEDTARALLAGAGFEDPAASYPILKNLVMPPDEKIASQKSRRLLERLAPLFVEELLKAPERGKTLVALAGYIDSLHAGWAYLSTFLENPATVTFLVKILGESRFFTDLLTRHPQAIDSLIARHSQEAPKDKKALEAELLERLAYSESFEDRLGVMRRFKNEEILIIGVRHLSGEIDSPTARWLVSELAEVCLAAAVDVAADEMRRKFGSVGLPDPVPFAILGMGKLGGMEMTYLSDVDVIFIYDHAGETVGRLAAHEWFSRLANRIISILSVPTADGTVFAIDARLRPSGQKGPLVSSLSSFRDYHRTTSKLWEKQALIKARPVTGPHWLTGEVAAIVRDCVMRTRITDADLAEIARLRGRMESEVALEDDLHVDLKTGHGGLVDVEFFVQAHILRDAGRHPEIMCQNTLEALAALRSAGLLDEEPYETLNSGYRFLSNLEDRLRIMEHRSVNRMPLGGDKLKGLAVRLGYGEDGEEKLLSDYFRVTGSIRRLYTSFFGQGEKMPHGDS